MNRIVRWLLTLVLVFSFVGGVAIALPITGVSAATTANVTLTALPLYIHITCNVSSPYAFGAVAESSTTNSSTTHFGIANFSNCQTDQTIGVNATIWSGGVTWAHAEDAVPDTDTAGLQAQRGGTWGSGLVIIRYTDPLKIYEDCPASTEYAFGISLLAPTLNTDNISKTITLVVTAAAG